METDEGSRHVLPFQLQLDKPLASQVKMAEWNPEKDLLEMVMEDSKVVLHCFTWQRLWTISPVKMNIIKLLNRLPTLKIYFMLSGHHHWSCTSSGLMPWTYFMRSLICYEALLMTMEEFLSLLGGARTSPTVHQFLVNSLGEVGMKCVSKVGCAAGKELLLVVLNHLQVI
ncbi:anaphase-promoting complex subunit 4-like [Eucalyptus grandis]|uniref:anaphase-promoting complex subunit 4-like n=1 Tax=Eucalyptus grandis TaxID=71139 RepID=UPI00192EB332|nr:anaphase-promoting complex subunit 4-like [Eucalyptus grandis]